MLNKEVQKYLDSIEKEGIVLDQSTMYGEHEIADNIKKIIDEQGEEYKLHDEDIAERIAFDFLPEYPDDKTGWRTYYGPMYVIPNKQRQMVEYPSIQSVSEQILSYWGDRANISKNSILLSRYADLVIDFSPTVINKIANYNLFHLVIDANIYISEKLLASPLDCRTKLERALNLAIQVNDKNRLKNAKEAVINLHKNVAVDDKAGLWVFAFKWLLLDYCEKVPITEEERGYLLNDLEERLERIKNQIGPMEHSVSLLAEYYAKQNDEANLMRVLEIFENAFKSDERNESSALLKMNAYDQIHEIYRKYRDRGFSKAKKAEDRVSEEIGSLDINWEKSLQKISVTKTIKNEDIEKFLKQIFRENESLSDTLTRTVLSFLPKKETIAKQLDEISKQSPIQFLCSTQVVSDEGIPVAKLSSLDDDYEKHFQRHASQFLQLGSIFMTFAIDELKKRASKKQIIDYFKELSLFKNENQDYVKRAISAYWENDYLVSSHLFVPLIESGVRELVRNCGGIVLFPNELGGYDFMGLSGLLKSRGDIVRAVFSQINNEMDFYFRMALTERLGLNLRNNFAHGLSKKAFFTREASDRLFHVLLCLSLVKTNKENEL